MRNPLSRGGGFGYGVDNPITIMAFLVGGVLFVVVGVALFLYLAPSYLSVARVALILGPFFGVLMLVVAESMYVGSTAGKPREAKRLVEDIPWGGDEVILDVGCGRGHVSIPATKRLTSGRITGLDSWNKRHISGNSVQSLMANARVNSVEDKLFPVKGVPTRLPFAEGVFDTIISCLGLGNLEGGAERREAVKQLAISLKLGGRISILVSGHSEQFRDALSDAGIAEVRIVRYRLGLFPPVQRITGRKPFA